MKWFYASAGFNNDQKKDLKQMVFKEDNSDKGQKVQQLCDQSLPDPDQKERIWLQITDEKSEESL